MTPSDWRYQRFWFASHLVQRSPPILQSLQLELRVVELRASHGAAWRKCFVTGKATFNDGNLLIEFALPLPHVGDIDRLQRRRDVGKHIALLHWCTQPWEPTLGR